jgi:hypothetical protein
LSNIQLRQLAGQIVLVNEDAPHAHKSAHDEDAHGNRPWASQDIGRHQRAVFGEHPGEFSAATPPGT